MGAYQELDPELAWKALEGYEDVLSSQARAQDAFYRQFRCLRCRGQVERTTDLRHAFDPTGEILVPRSLLRCPSCALVFDPHTGLTVSVGHSLPEEPAAAGKTG